MNGYRPTASRPVPSHALTDEEKEQILEVCRRETFADLPLGQIVPILLDKGVYIASESSLYRVLKAHNQLHHRGRSNRPQPRKKPDTFVATEANQVWTWDITYLPGETAGEFYYLYQFVDIFSRKIVGSEVYDQENGQLAADLIHKLIIREQCVLSPPVLHSDNGAPMKSFTFKAKLESLGVVRSYSRPRVSNDNPFSESLFRTLKYRPEWPSKGFKSLDEAREWVDRFTHWYNKEHRHSQINFVTPDQKHRGADREILQNRKKNIEEAKARHPARWSGETRNCDRITKVYLNPEKDGEAVSKDSLAA